MKRARVASCLILATLSCSSQEAPVVAETPALGASAGLGCDRVGVLLPGGDFRFEAIDAPILADRIGAVTGHPVDLVLADSRREAAEAEALIKRGACILVVTSGNPDHARATVLLAAARGVPVIAYDRLIQAPELGFYVTFDNLAVGRLQGQYIVDHRKDHAGCPNAAGNHLALVHGDGQDPAARLFHQGVMERLQPLIDDHTLNPVYDAFTPSWDSNEAASAIQGLLDTFANQLQVVYSANDDMAGAMLSMLRERGLNGRMLVTGQDASPAAITSIILGDQAMTVAKRIEDLAQSTADLVGAIRAGTGVGVLTHGATTDTRHGGKIPTVLAPPTAVDRCNVRSLVLPWYPGICSTVAAGACEALPTGDDLCNGAAAETCPAEPLDMAVVDPSDYGFDTCFYNACLHNCRSYPRNVVRVPGVAPDDPGLVVPEADFYCLSNADTTEKGYQDRSLLMVVQRKPAGGIIDQTGELAESRAVPYTETVTLRLNGPGLAFAPGYCYRTITQVVLSNGYPAAVSFGPFTCYP